MRSIRKLFVVSLAVVGAVRAWELAMPRFEDLRRRVETARERARPAARQAVSSAEQAWEQARDVVGQATSGSPSAPSEPALSRAEAG